MRQAFKYFSIEERKYIQQKVWGGLPAILPKTPTMTNTLFVLLVVGHYYASLFMHSFFLHRYVTHEQFTMNRFWEKIFYLLTWLLQGPAFLDPIRYRIMHLLHHEHSDTPLDPHSPKNFSRSKHGYDVLTAGTKMMLATRDFFCELEKSKAEVIRLYRERRFPKWKEFQKFTSTKISLVSMAVCYTALYALLVPTWWCWFFLPVTLLNGPIQGAIVNWCGHMWGHRNYTLPDNSRNTPLATLMLGETNQNNHHYNPKNPNFGKRWFEFDPIFSIILIFQKLRILRMVSTFPPHL